MKSLKQVDPEIYQIIQQETCRIEDRILLIASENLASPAVMEAASSVLTNKYAEGYPGHRYYGGCQFVDVARSEERRVGEEGRSRWAAYH